MKKILLAAALLVLVGAGCTDYRLNQKNLDDAKNCIDTGGAAYAYNTYRINCEFPYRDNPSNP